MRIRTVLPLIAISLAGGSSYLAAQTLTANPTSLTLSARVGGSADTKQLSISAPANAAVQFAIFSDQPWLKTPVPPASGFVTPANVTITADPTGLAAGTYTGHLSLVTASATTTVTASFVVSPIGASPTSLTFGPYTVGTVPAASQNIALSGTGNFNVAQSGSCTWLSVSPTFGSVPTSLTASLNGSIVGGLAANTYTCTVNITPVGSTIAVPVIATLTVLPTPQVTVNPSPMTFNVQNGGANNITSQTLTISANPAQQIAFFVQSSVTGSVPNWITFNPANGNTDPNTGTAQVTVTVNTTGLTVGNTYNGTLTISTPNGTPAQTSIPVKLNFTSTPFINANPSSLTYSAQFGGGNPADQTVSVTSTDNSATTYAIGVTYQSGANWLVVPNSGSTASPFTVSVRSGSLAPGTYAATVSVTAATGGSRVDIPVALTVTNNGALTTNVTSMSFPFQVGQSVPAAQNLTISSATGVPINYTVTPATANCGNGWLQFNGSASAINGSTTSTTPVSVTIVPTGFTAGTTCTGTITIAGTNASTGAAVGNVVVNVSSVVTATPQLVATPASISVTVPAGGQVSSQPTITLSTTSGTDVLNYTVTAVNQGGAPSPWLSASVTQGSTSTSGGTNVVTAFIFSNTLPAGTYNGSITFTATTGGSSVTVPVTLTVTSGAITVSTNSLSFATIVGGNSPAAQTVTVGSSTSTALTYAAAVANPSQTPWLSVSPATGTTTANPTLTVSVDASKLTAPGTYTGAITVNTPGSSQTINVTATVTAGSLSVSPSTTLSFNQIAGGPSPAAQTLNVTSNPAGLPFTVTFTTATGGTWLNATPASGTAPGAVSVTVNGATLTAGQYTGTVTIASAGATGSPINVPVVLNVASATTVTVTPTALTFNYTLGLTQPATQTFSVSSTPSATVNAAVTSNSPWLTVTPSSALTPATFTVGVNTANLTTAGNLTGTITVTSANLIAPATVTVTLNVSAVPKPVITAIGNAGSYAGGAISPGENIVIFGTGIGPASLAQNGVTNNAFGTTVGSTRVLFDNVAAPIIYASATQTSVMVPYGVFGRASTNIVVEYAGVQSNPVPFVVSNAAPGIYTLNQAGNGPGAIINQDGVTVNGAATPEKRGNIISVYMTGEGQTNPAGQDGVIIQPTGLKKPLLTVTATVGGVDAPVLYAGSAAFLVSGVMQVNLQIPTTVTPGSSVPIVISVGGTPSQSGVTVAVQ